MTHLITVVFLYHKYHPEDGRTTGRNMLVKVEVKVRRKIKAHLLVVFTFYKDMFKLCVHFIHLSEKNIRIRKKNPHRITTFASTPTHLSG